MNTERTPEETQELLKQQYEWNQLTARQKKKYIPKQYRFSSLITSLLTNKKK